MKKTILNKGENGTVKPEKVTVNSENGTVNSEDGIVNQRLIEMITLNRQITINKLVKDLNLSRNKILKHLKTLRENGRLRWVGSDKTGHWEVIEQDVD